MFEQKRMAEGKTWEGQTNPKRVAPSGMKAVYLCLGDGGHELDDAVRDSLLELETPLFPQERGQEAHQYAVLQGVLQTQLE